MGGNSWQSRHHDANRTSRAGWVAVFRQIGLRITSPRQLQIVRFGTRSRSFSVLGSGQGLAQNGRDVDARAVREAHEGELRLPLQGGIG